MPPGTRKRAAVATMVAESDCVQPVQADGFHARSASEVFQTLTVGEASKAGKGGDVWDSQGGWGHVCA